MKKYIGFLLIIFVLLVASTAVAGQLINEDAYIIEEETVIEDDLYIVSSDEIQINGTVKGDVVAAAPNVQVDGKIEGDLLVLAAGVQIEGEVTDDARLFALSSVKLEGTIGDDLAIRSTIAEFNGSGDPDEVTARNLMGEQLAMNLVGRQYDPGLTIEATGVVDGDLILNVRLARIEGVIRGELLGTVSELVLDKGQIESGADVIVLSDIEADADTLVGGTGFRYQSLQPLNIPSTLSDNNTYVEIEQPDASVNSNVLLLVQQLIGRLLLFSLLGWALLRFAPRRMMLSVAALNTNMSNSSLMSLLVLFGLPFLTGIVVIILLLLVNVELALGILSFVFAVYMLLWNLSPLIVGLWIGQWLSNQAYQGLMIGMTILVVVMYLPILGGFVAMSSMILALAGLLGSFYIEPPEDLPERAV